MPFFNISFYNFRNLKNSTIDLNSKEVFFVGENGQGKSNILESLYYSAYGSSFRERNDSRILKNETDEFSLISMYSNQEESLQRIKIIYQNKKKIIEKNGKKIKTRKELVNTIPCVVFCHNDMNFAVGSPEFRRYFIDQTLTMHDSIYLENLINYKKVLKSRNLILQNKNYEMISVYNSLLVKHGFEIQKKRKKAIFQINEIFGKLYEEISGIDGIYVEYLPSWKNNKSDSEKNILNEEQIFEIIKNTEEQDKILKTTTYGPHRDKIIFVKDNKNFIQTASTGQCRLISLLLRISQAVYYKRITGINPVILMDDVMLELDPKKREKFISLIPDYDQLFCTFLPGEPYQNYKSDNSKVYKIENGEWELLKI